jgi:head-tail adaptor
MKRAAVVFLITLAVGATMGILSYGFFQDRSSPVDWLRKEFSLNEEESARIVALNAEYGPKCREMCTRIEQTDSRLARLMKSSATVTLEIRAALEESDRIRTECRLKMLEHFYEVAAVMPEEKRRKYLQIVLPVVLNPGGPSNLNASIAR